MSVKKKPVTFETTDGEKFSTARDAERHQTVINAVREHKHTQRVLEHALATEQKTADGHPFSFGVLQDYWYITDGRAGLPQLRAVHFLGIDYDLRLQEGKSTVILCKRKDGRTTDYPINTLYFEKAAANKALLQAQEQRMVELSADVESLRAELKGKS